eukprot:765900-Hanusia_phi.AAC.1
MGGIQVHVGGQEKGQEQKQRQEQRQRQEQEQRRTLKAGVSRRTDMTCQLALSCSESLWEKAPAPTVTVSLLLLPYRTSIACASPCHTRCWRESAETLEERRRVKLQERRRGEEGR